MKKILNIIINVLAVVFEPIVKRCNERIEAKQQDVAVSQYQQNLEKMLKKQEATINDLLLDYKMKNINKNINKIALWKANKEKVKQAKNPKTKPITRVTKFD